MSMEEMLPPDEAVPEMPTARRVNNRRARHKEPAFNEVSVELSVVLGRASMPIHQLLKMGRGAVIELGASVDDDAAIYANNRLIARGQVVVVGDKIAISITETVDITET
jgi:flagellar motor switch protein FliN/FliY